jgi:poly [ADP-ribose] polymerase
MLLSEVALGDMYELLHAQYMEKPPAGKHSTKGIGYPAKLSSFKKKNAHRIGVGKTWPNPAEAIKYEGDIEVPLGKGIDATKIQPRLRQSSLLYNGTTKSRCTAS